MAALQNVTLTEPVQIANTATAYYTNPSSTKTFVRGILLFNSNTTTETVKIYYVPDSSGSVGTAAAANQLFQLDLQPNESLIIEVPFSFILSDTNDTIQASTTTASKVTIEITGDTYV